MLLLLASTIGATVTPWMVFFQQASTADKGMTTRDIGHGRFDTALGAGLAAVFGVGALVAGAALATHNGANIQGLAGAGFPAALDTRQAFKALQTSGNAEIPANLRTFTSGYSWNPPLPGEDSHSGASCGTQRVADGFCRIGVRPNPRSGAGADRVRLGLPPAFD